MIIDSQDALAILIERARKAGSIALDTEFVWERTFYPRLGVVQAALPDGQCVLIDPLAVPDLRPLGKILANPSVTKVLHDAQQDLTILRRATERAAVNVFDTRTAAGFVGTTCTVSLQQLVRDLLGIRLPKTETRTDWLRRPLSERQISYALDDVRYLSAIKDALLDTARRLGHESWLLEELSAYDRQSMYEDRDPQSQFERVKGAGRLSARKLGVLRELAAWRENEARKRDVPRERVAADSTIVAIAQRLPENIGTLSAIKGVPRNVMKRYGAAVLKAVLRGLDVPSAQRPQPSYRTRRGRNVKQRVDTVLGNIRAQCEKEKIDHHMVTTRAELVALAHAGRNASPDHHRLLHGWRSRFIGHETLALLMGAQRTQLV